MVTSTYYDQATGTYNQYETYAADTGGHREVRAKRITARPQPPTVVRQTVPVPMMQSIPSHHKMVVKKKFLLPQKEIIEQVPVPYQVEQPIHHTRLVRKKKFLPTSSGMQSTVSDQYTQPSLQTYQPRRSIIRRNIPQQSVEKWEEEVEEYPDESIETETYSSAVPPLKPRQIIDEEAYLARPIQRKYVLKPTFWTRVKHLLSGGRRRAKRSNGGFLWCLSQPHAIPTAVRERPEWIFNRSRRRGSGSRSRVYRRRMRHFHDDYHQLYDPRLVFGSSRNSKRSSRWLQLHNCRDWTVPLSDDECNQRIHYDVV